jgi:hypothetical protein
MNQKTYRNSINMTQRSRKTYAQSLLLASVIGQVALFSPSVYAQGLSPDQDSLLPPEVVPLDASGGVTPPSPSLQSNFSQPNNFASAPSQAAQAFNPADMQTAQQWRQQAFNSMMNNPNAQPAFAPQTNPQLMAMQGQNGQPGQNPAQMNNQPNGQANGLGQSPWMNANGQPMLGANQSQTLSGAVQQPNQSPTGKSGSKLSSVSHAVGMMSLFGGGMLMGSLMSGRMAINPMSTGLMGVGMTNYMWRGF